jgi:hypothetical protein
MANIRIVYYAALRTGDTELRRVADEHSLTTRRHLVRGDGSTVHEGVFDPASGEFLRESTHQGWRGDGFWARGLTWALYGFVNAFQYTKDKRFLDTAMRCAEFYIARTPEHGVPPNDWEEPDPPYAVESSVAAIGAAGFLQLAATLPAGAEADRCHSYGHRIVATLCSSDFLADATPGWEGILRHGIYHQRNGLGVDESQVGRVLLRRGPGSRARGGRGPGRCRAAVLERPEEGLRVEQIPVSAPARDEVPVRVDAVGVCHTDLHVMKGEVPFPTPAVVGHEVSGVVAAVGPGVRGLEEGNRLVAPFIMPCGRWGACAAGRDDLCTSFFEQNRLRGTLFDGTSRLRRCDGSTLAMYSMAGLAEYCVVPERACSRFRSRCRSASPRSSAAPSSPPTGRYATAPTCASVRRPSSWSRAESGWESCRSRVPSAPPA